MERLLKTVQYLSLISLIKPTTVYILAHHWHNLTALSKVPWNEQSSAGILYILYILLHKNYSRSIT